jgi:hypothetical protein
VGGGKNDGRTIVLLLPLDWKDKLGSPRAKCCTIRCWSSCLDI